MLGYLQVSSEFDGHPFRLENLHEGSVLNHRAFFMEDISQVNVVAGSQCKVLELNFEILESFMVDHP